ncbi:uncharacterized protein VTP21DRAFT_11316 [Calcarisporiella thermophila]|uniref:uncharacterized protein n=1 Tax=Calcarisporiella thermophila TaxID=911321 RepID=UPI0037444D72
MRLAAVESQFMYTRKHGRRPLLLCSAPEQLVHQLCTQKQQVTQMSIDCKNIQDQFSLARGNFLSVANKWREDMTTDASESGAHSGIGQVVEQIGEYAKALKDSTERKDSEFLSKHIARLQDKCGLALEADVVAKGIKDLLAERNKLVSGQLATEIVKCDGKNLLDHQL